MKNFDKLYAYIKINLPSLKKLGLDIEFIDNSYGDDNYQETNTGFKFNFNDKQYTIIYNQVVEDQEDWGQAESYICEICDVDDLHTSPEEVLDLLINLQSIKRDTTINNILE